MRMRRNRRFRRTEAMLRLFTETDVPVRCLVPAYFVVEGEGTRREVPEHSGLVQVSCDVLRDEARRARDGGAQAIMLFAVPSEKGIAHATARDSLGCRAVAACEGSGLVRMADVCLCSYTHDGHCGLWREGSHGRPGGVQNDATVEVLADMAVALAQAGAEVVAPSDMMDGRVAAIRAALDHHALGDTLVLSYAAKMASAFYGPFRHAAESAPQHGDRRGYQVNPANGREALREMATDVEEGADMLMMKPALTNLDLIAAARARWEIPIVAYQVSGEYAMIAEASRAGRIDRARAARETLVSIRRAGADLVVSYFAPEAWDGRLPL
jgi:porphobilinogen synthase